MNRVSLIRGLNGTSRRDLTARTVGRLAWTNVDIGKFINAQPQDHTIDFLLQLLMSTGSALNHDATTNWDELPNGIGLGIPEDQIDTDSFVAVKGHDDWDPNQLLFFRITEPQPAKEFIETEICRPFGLCLRPANDGRIQLVRPRHPQKFYIGSSNRFMRFRVNQLGWFERTIKLPIGVYTGPEMAAVISEGVLMDFTALNYNQTIPFTCTYSTSTHKFTFTCDRPFDILSAEPNDHAWRTLGWTVFGDANTTNTQSSTSDTPRGTFSGLTLTQDDMWGVRQIENGDDRITRVAYWCDYDVDTDTYKTYRPYVDVESANLGDILGAHDYVVRSKGLISGGPNTPAWCKGSIENSGGCKATEVVPPQNAGVGDDTWSLLLAKHLLDRYKSPPLKFRAHLKWKWNTLEVGDVVSVSYSIPGVFVDHETGAATLTNRLFEIVELHPNFDGSLEVTFLGHRYVGY